MEPVWQLPTLPSSSPMPVWDCPELAGEMGFGAAAAVTSHPASLVNSVQCPVLAGAAEQPPDPCRAHPAPNRCGTDLSCTQIHHGRDTQQGKEGDRFLGKSPPPARPRAKGTSRMTPAAQDRGCRWLRVRACPQPAPAQSDTNSATPQCSQHQQLVLQAQHLQISSHRPKSCCEHSKAQLSPA